MKKFQSPLCPDAFSSFICHDPRINEQNTRVYNATLHLFQTVPFPLVLPRLLPLLIETDLVDDSHLQFTFRL